MVLKIGVHDGTFHADEIFAIKKHYIQFILSFNPIDENHWIKKRLVDTDIATVLHTTYKDNVYQF